ncbi:hypothetical protein FQN49_000527 [Arthroderma sp. PD_2]|nr:hypothetical protein FQN49_000527 [Arthroderma sp. PD_2]
MASQSPLELLHFPNEILLLIGKFLDPPELNSLMQTTSDLVPLLRPLLHEKAATFDVNHFIPALAWAAENGRLPLVKAILDRGKGKIKLTAIILATFMACEHGYPEMVQILLRALPLLPMLSTKSGAKYFFVGTQLHIMTRKARNSYASEDEDLSAHLYVACKNDHKEIVRMLFDRGMRDMAKLRVLLAIAEEGLDEAASILLDAGMKDSPESISRAIFSAVRCRHINMVRILMNSGANFEMPIMAYHTAIKQPLSMMDELLFELRDGIRLPDMTSIFSAAARSGNYFYIDTMLALGNKCPIDSAIYGSALIAASACPRTSDNLLRLLISAGAGHITNNDLSRALHSIVGFERPTIASFLLRNGADPCKRLEGLTALHTTTISGQSATVQALLDYGADASIKSDDGQTPLHLAARNNHFLIARHLIEAGADISAKDNNDLTPLHCAANNGSFDVASLLVKKRADPWAQTASGWTPLNLAARSKHDRVLELLLATQEVVPFSVEQRKKIVSSMGDSVPDF